MEKEVGRVSSLDGLQLFARLEANGLTWRNINLLPCARVTPDACLARPNIEDAKAAEFDSAAATQGALHAFKNRFHSLFGLSARYVCTADNRVHDVELDHARLLPAQMEAYANTGT